METVQQDKVIQNEARNEKLGAAIKLVVDTEAVFKLYSFRIISHEDFLTAVENCHDEYSEKMTYIQQRYTDV